MCDHLQMSKPCNQVNIAKAIKYYKYGVSHSMDVTFLVWELLNFSVEKY